MAGRPKGAKGRGLGLTERKRKGKHTFNEAVVIYREKLSQEGKLTRDTDLRIERLRERFGRDYLEDITPLVWHNYLSRAFRFCKPSTMGRYLNVMNAIMANAEYVGWIVGRPRYKQPRGGRNGARNSHLDTHEIMPVVEYVATRYSPLHALIILLLTDTGMRWGEALRLRWCDLGPEWVVIQRAEYSHSKTKMRRVPTSPRLLRFMDRHGFTPGNPHDSIIRSLWHEHPRGIATKVIRALRDACMTLKVRMAEDDLRLHDLRHTFAYQCAEGGAELADLKDLMGHDSVDMTMRYRGFVKNKARNIIKETMK